MIFVPESVQLISLYFYNSGDYDDDNYVNDDGDDDDDDDDDDNDDNAGDAVHSLLKVSRLKEDK